MREHSSKAENHENVLGSVPGKDFVSFRYILRFSTE